MNILKKIALSAAIVATFATVSAPAFAAEEHVDKNAVVKAAAAETIAKVNEAVSIAEGNGDKAAFLAAIGEARQAQKEFRYEQIERLRQKLNDKLRAAREAADSGTMQEAGAAAKEAATLLTEMKGIYDAAHK
jgi:large subunit ribosomal protein L7/L12